MLMLKCIKDVYIEGTDRLAFKKGLYYQARLKEHKAYNIKYYITDSEVSNIHELGDTLDNDFIRKYFIVDEIK